MIKMIKKGTKVKIKTAGEVSNFSSYNNLTGMFLEYNSYEDEQHCKIKLDDVSSVLIGNGWTFSPTIPVRCIEIIQNSLMPTE